MPEGRWVHGDQPERTADHREVYQALGVEGQQELYLENPNMFACPKRTGEVGEDDTWLQKGPVVRCSYCGSLQPDTFMSLLDRGWGLSRVDEENVQIDSPKGLLLRYKQNLWHLDDKDRREVARLLTAPRSK